MTNFACFFLEDVFFAGAILSCGGETRGERRRTGGVPRRQSVRAERFGTRVDTDDGTGGIRVAR